MRVNYEDLLRLVNVVVTSYLLLYYVIITINGVMIVIFIKFLISSVKIINKTDYFYQQTKPFRVKT